MFVSSSAEGVGADLVPAPGLAAFRCGLREERAVLPDLTELTASPWIPKLSVHGGGETPSKAGGAAVGEWVCCSQDQDPRIPVC